MLLTSRVLAAAVTVIGVVFLLRSRARPIGHRRVVGAKLVT